MYEFKLCKAFCVHVLFYSFKSPVMITCNRYSYTVSLIVQFAKLNKVRNKQSASLTLFIVQARYLSWSLSVVSMTSKKWLFYFTLGVLKPLLPFLFSPSCYFYTCKLLLKHINHFTLLMLCSSPFILSSILCCADWSVMSYVVQWSLVYYTLRLIHPLLCIK
jgi:hypothetical protein